MAYQPKSYRKFLATTAAAAMVATVAAPFATPSADAASNKFSDVKAGAWYVKGIDYLVEKGALNGYADGTFKPNNGITRAEVAKVLVEALGLETDSNPTLKFSDTKNDAWYAPYVGALVAEGVIEGNPDGTFQPNAQITRAALAKMVVEAYDLEAGAGKASFSDLVPGAWYVDYIQTLASNGIVEGKPNGKFEPNATVTRAEAATFVHRTEVPSERVGGGEVSGAVKVINNTTVEVTLAKAVNEVKASDFSIDGLEVTNAVVKQTDNRVVVLTTAAQEGGKNYTVKYQGATVGTFTGVSAVIPEKVTVETNSIQGIVGQQVTLKADIGQKTANVPVTFNVDAANNSLNKDQVEEVLTDADGIATFTYTQYNAGHIDDIAVYPTGAPAKRDFATVYWGVDTILTIVADDKKSNELNNGENKVYKVTYKDPKTGKPVENKEIHITLEENVNVEINKITQARVNGKHPYQLTNGRKGDVVSVKTDSKGEATVTLSGTNTKATPIVFVDGHDNKFSTGNRGVSEADGKLDTTELQAKAEQVTFGSVHLKYEIEVTRDGGEEAAIKSASDDNGRVYKVVVKDENGKAASGEVLNVAFDEVLDKVISTNTKAEFLDSEKDKDLKGKSKYRNANDKQQIELTLDSKGEGEFRIVSSDNKDYATPVVWIDINSSNNKEGTLEEGEPKKVAPMTYFADEKVAGSSLKVFVPADSQTENKDNRIIDAKDGAEFRFAVANQSGKKISPSKVNGGEATFEVLNTSREDVLVFKDSADFKAYLNAQSEENAKKGTVVSRSRSATERVTIKNDGTASIYVASVDGKSAAVEVKAYGEAKEAGADGKTVRLSESKVAKATFKSTEDIGTSHTGKVESFDKDKKKIKFVNKKELDYKTEYDDNKVDYYNASGKTPVPLNAQQFEELIDKYVKEKIEVEVHYFKNSDGRIEFRIMSVGTAGQGDLATAVNAVNIATTEAQVRTAIQNLDVYKNLTPGSKDAVVTNILTKLQGGFTYTQAALFADIDVEVQVKAVYAAGTGAVTGDPATGKYEKSAGNSFEISTADGLTKYNKVTVKFVTQTTVNNNATVDETDVDVSFTSGVLTVALPVETIDVVAGTATIHNDLTTANIATAIENFNGGAELTTTVTGTINPEDLVAQSITLDGATEGAAAVDPTLTLTFSHALTTTTFADLTFAGASSVTATNSTAAVSGDNKTVTITVNAPDNVVVGDTINVFGNYAVAGKTIIPVTVTSK